MDTQNHALATRFGSLALLVLPLCWLLLPTPSQATPQFARQHQLRCTACHALPPGLNEHGRAFQARGYRLPDASASGPAEVVPAAGFSTLPLAAWVTTRFEDQGAQGSSDLLLPKVELISGGTLGPRWSYFVEWRVVSLSLERDGGLRDRGGRFEDLFFQWQAGRHAFKLGQYRALNQADVSLRLSPSEPLLSKNDLATSDHRDPRIASLSRFSPSGRSPSLGYAFQSLAGQRAGDGLFHHITIPFLGELSLPLGAEASDTASFELGGAKGIFAETFYRSGEHSIGVHAFVGDDAWLATALATAGWKKLLVTAGLGIDDSRRGVRRQRLSAAFEYLAKTRDTLRIAAGLRVENVSDDGKRTAVVPYLALSGPNTRHTFLVQLQYRSQQGSDNLVIDFSLLF